MRPGWLVFLLLIFSSLFYGSVFGQQIDYKGELTFMIYQNEEFNQKSWLSRYLPEFRFQGSQGEGFSWDAGLAGYLYAYDHPIQGKNQNAEVFRAWLRVFDDTIEYKIGLQELSFGPASILRSLQWFDTKDVLDPTSFTKGVKGALVRLSTEGNSDYWIWSLYGNENSYASTSFLSDPDKPEFGGRAQFSSELVELGFTLHQRQVVLMGETSINEDRMGLDGKLDLPYNGLWFESMMINRDIESFIKNQEWWDGDLLLTNQERMVTLGIDFTWDMVSEGVLITIEKSEREYKVPNGYFRFREENFALMASMNLGLLDSFRFTFKGSGNPTKELTQFDWQRTYDSVLWNLYLYQTRRGDASAISGMGLTIQYNH